MSENFKSFPLIPISNWNNLRSQFKKSIPGTITSNYLSAVIGISEPSAKSTVFPTLRQIGLVDKEGNINLDLAKKLRDDNSYPDLCVEILKKIYPKELTDAFPDKDSNKERVKSWFMNHTGAGESAVGKMTSFYFTLLEANPNSNGTAAAARGKEVKSKVSKQNQGRRNTTQKINEATNAEQNSRKLSNPDLNINIQIHISSDASPDQIKSIFENMSKYIYKD